MTSENRWKRNQSQGTPKASRAANSSRGIALIATLLLLSLMIALTLGMTIAVTSDTLITLYYRNFRSSFYAADSGTNIARQYIANQITAAMPATFVNTTQPIPAGTEATVQASLLSQYGNGATASNLNITSGAAANSWTGTFYIASSPAPALTLVSCTPQFVGTGTPTNAGPYNCTTNVPVCATCTAAAFTLKDFVYQYAYSYTSMGQSKGGEQALVQDIGNINITVNVAVAPGSVTSFAAWGMFIDQNPICDGSTLVGGTISGPVFTNGAWNFGTTAYTFTDTVGSVSPNFGYQFSGQCDQKSSPSDSNNGNSIAPRFSGSPQYKLGQTAVALPANSYSQKEAVVDQTGTAGSISNAAMNASLKTYNGTVYPAAGTTNAAVYLPYTSTTSAVCPHPPCMTGGGIYVEGNANNVTLAASTPTSGALSGHALQIFTITQGSTTTTTVTEDLTAATTTVTSQIGTGGVTTLAIAGLPQDSVNGVTTPATMVYVDGNIGNSSSNTGLSGPGQGVAAIQNNGQVTVTANGSVNVIGDLLYSTPPISIPADTIAVSSSVNSEVLGIFTASGNVNLDNQQSNGNLELDASIATIATGGSGGLVNTGNAINTLTIVGGRIQNTIQNINTTTRNVWFDRRFAQGNFAPPWFPSTTVVPLATETNGALRRPLPEPPGWPQTSRVCAAP